MLYAVADRTILYVAPIWHNGKVVVENWLLSMQKDLLLCVTKCYAIVSTDALHVFLGVLPLDLCVELDRDFTALVLWNKSVDGTRLNSEPIDLWRLIPRRGDLWWIR